VRVLLTRVVGVFRHILNYLRNGCVVGVDTNPSLRDELLLVKAYPLSTVLRLSPSLSLSARGESKKRAT